MPRTTPAFDRGTCMRARVLSSRVVRQECARWVARRSLLPEVTTPANAKRRIDAKRNARRSRRCTATRRSRDRLYAPNQLARLQRKKVSVLGARLRSEVSAYKL